MGQSPIRQETQFPLLPVPDDRNWGYRGKAPNRRLSLVIISYRLKVAE
nr:MAG TPA: hypothetical protein [Microviridae sp.]